MDAITSDIERTSTGGFTGCLDASRFEGGLSILWSTHGWCALVAVEVGTVMAFIGPVALMSLFPVLGSKANRENGFPRAASPSWEALAIGLSILWSLRGLTDVAPLMKKWIFFQIPKSSYYTQKLENNVKIYKFAK